MSKNYNLESTLDPTLFRLVDRKGDWSHYFHEPTKSYLRAVNHIIKTGFAQPGLLEWAKKVSPEEAERKLSEAGERGDKIHKFIDLIFNTKSVNFTRETKIWNRESKQEEVLSDDEWDAILAFKEFWTRHEPLLVAHEISCYSLKYGYAGTTDAVIILTKNCGVKTCKCDEYIGKPGIWDWKSGGGIYESYGPQLSAYGNSESLQKLFKTLDLKLDYSAVLRIGTNHKTTGGYQLEIYDKKETKEHFNEFLSAITISNSSYRPFDPETDIYEIPDEIKLEIKDFKIKSKKPKKETKK